MTPQDLADVLCMLDPLARVSIKPSKAAIAFKDEVSRIMPSGVTREWENVRPYVYFLIEKQAVNLTGEEFDAAFVTHAIRRRQW